MRRYVTPGAKTINVFRACIGAQLAICAQKLCNFVLFSTVSLRFVLSRVCVFPYRLGPRGKKITDKRLMTYFFRNCISILILGKQLHTRKVAALLNVVVEDLDTVEIITIFM